MRIVDLCFVTPRIGNTPTVAEKAAEIKKKTQVRRNNREEDLKLKAMRKLNFGNFMVDFPTRYQCQYDFPLPTSAGESISLKNKSRAEVFEVTDEEVKCEMPVQKLLGVMIHRSADEYETNSNESFAKKKTFLKLLKKSKSKISRGKKSYNAIV